MSISVQEIYDETCDILLESGGLQLELLDDDQFLAFAEAVAVDFLQKTGMVKDIGLSGTDFEVDGDFAIREYAEPDTLLELDEVFFEGHYLIQNDSFGIDHSQTQWEYAIEEPEQWHKDRLPAQSFAVFPAPPIPDSKLQLVGTKNIVTSPLTKGTTIPEIPALFTFYLWAGVMQKIHTMDGELKDDFKALYFGNRYTEGVNLGKAIMNEVILREV